MAADPGGFCSAGPSWPFIPVAISALGTFPQSKWTRTQGELPLLGGLRDRGFLTGCHVGGFSQSTGLELQLLVVWPRADVPGGAATKIYLRQ